MTAEHESLAVLLKETLSTEFLRVIGLASEVASDLGLSLYLVGGAVRDLLLQRDTVDIDLVTEGDIVALASALGDKLGGEALIHSRFGTARVRWDTSSLDLAMARAECYERPGALPIVHPGSIEEDLRRRDFTINSMALDLSLARFGKMMDPFGGQKDLRVGLIRILHNRSFTDDPTRMFRAVRYEQRFSFRLEHDTERLLRSNTGSLPLVSGDRIRHELELIMKEGAPEKALQRADHMGLLKEVHPGLKADEWLSRKYRQARAMLGSPSRGLYMGLLSYSLTLEETEELIDQLKIPRTVAEVVRDCARLRGTLPALEDERQPPSSICEILRGLKPAAIMTCLVATDSDWVAGQLQSYLTKWRHVRTALDGLALQDMGVPPGSKVGEILGRLRKARVDGVVTTREDEVRMVKEMGYG